MWLRILGLIVAAISYSQSAVAEQQKVRIAFILPLSGPLAQLGGELRDAALLAYDNLPESQRDSITVSFEDDQFKSTGALSAYQKLTQEGPIAALLAVGPQSIDPLIPLTEKAGTILFVVTGNGDYSSKHFAARLWVNAATQASALLPYMRAQGVKRIALVSSQHEAMAEYAQMTRRSGFDVKLEHEVLPTDLDFRATITRLKKMDLDGIVAPLLPPQLSQFSKQLRELGCTTRIFSFVNAEVKSAVENSGGSMNGILYVAPVSEDNFSKTFYGRFGYQPQTIAATAYDAVQLFSQAVAGGAQRPEQIMAALRKEPAGTSGALGSFRLDEKNEFSIPVRIKEIVDGKFVVLSQTTVNKPIERTVEARRSS